MTIELLLDVYVDIFPLITRLVINAQISQWHVVTDSYGLSVGGNGKVHS